MSTRDQNRFNQLIIQFLGEINRRIDDCFANISAASSGGTTGSWVLDSNTWTFSSADAPIYVVSVNADVTGTISVGMRIRVVHGGITKYLIVHAVGAFSAGVTLLTLYGGTTFTLSATAITATYYSPAKYPFGFPASPDLWSETATSTANAAKATPTANVWYGGTQLTPTGISIVAPIGVWNTQYKILAELVTTVAVVTGEGVRFTLSDGDSSETDASWTNQGVTPFPVGTAAARWPVQSPYKPLTITVKKTQYVNIFTGQVAVTSIAMRGDLVTSLIKLVDAYL